jgi:hypothetical protein
MCRHRADIGGFVVALEISCRGGTHAETAYRGLGFAEWGRLSGGYHDHGDQIIDEVRLWMPIVAG